MICTYGAFYKKGYGDMICPNCKKENINEYATVCAYCGQPLYSGENADAKAVELSAKQKKDKVKSAIITVVSIILVIAVVIVAIIIPKPDKDGDTTDSCYCSICGDWLTASDEYAARGWFCPNCGAKMQTVTDCHTLEEGER